MPVPEQLRNTLRVVNNIRFLLENGLFPGAQAGAIPEAQQMLADMAATLESQLNVVAQPEPEAKEDNQDGGAA
jgi:hypothetical protein